MRILGIETALGFSEAALLDEGRNPPMRSLVDQEMYSENVMRLLRTLLQESDVPLGGIDGIAVSIGPGSFTGLRIGLSVAKGLAVASDRPLVGVSTLDALASSVLYNRAVGEGCRFLVLIDAKRGEYYCGSYRNDAGVPLQTGEPRVLTGIEILHDPSTKDATIVAGDGRGRLEEQLRRVDPVAAANLNLIEKSSSASPARAVATLGLQKLKRREFADVVSLEPSYLKDFLIKTLH